MGGGLSRLVFQPPYPSYNCDPNLVWLTTRNNNRIPGFHIFRSSENLTILFSHGNAEDIGMIVNYFKKLAQLWDVNIFAYEYSGYGRSTGKPSEDNVYADIDAAYEYLTQRFQLSSDKIVLYGRSLGTAPSIDLASRKSVKGIILQSPLSSIHRIGLNLRFTLPGDMFCSVDKISKIKCPVFFIHGVRDEVVPFSHSVQLYNKCPNPVTPYWLEDAGHNNIEATGNEEFLLNVKRFLKLLIYNTEASCKEVEKKRKKLIWRMPVSESV